MNIEEVFTKLRPIMGSQLDTLWLEYLVADPSLRQTIERTLRVTLAQRLAETFEKEQVLLKPPPRDLAEGEYPVGMIHYGKDRFYPFSLREDEFIQHIGIFGRSGSGKTNLAYLLLHGLIKAQKPFLVFDWKRNYRDLISAPEFANLIIFTVGRDVAPFRFNPLIPPPGTPAKVWLKKLIEIMCHAYFLGEGVTVLLMRAIDHLYQQGGMYDDKSKSCPTMADVRDYLLAYKAKGREAGWMESAMRAVEVLCFGEMGNVLSSAQPFDIAKLLDRNVILELDALTNADKTFLIESLLLWIHHYRMSQTQREDFKHSIIIEEAHHILLRKKQEVTGEEAVTDIILREIRELGESVICLDQHPSLISKPALGNTYTSFVFNLKHRSDIAMMQDCLHLDSEQTRYLGRLEVGWAVAKLQGRWFFPFLIKLPLVRLKKGSVTDRDIQHRAIKFTQDSSILMNNPKGFSAVISAPEGNSSPQETPGRKIPLIPSGGKKEKKDMEDGCAIRLTTQERKFLMDIWQHPNSAVTERYQRLDVSHRIGNNIQNSLFRLGLISSSFIVLSKWRIKILLLKEKGRKILGISASQSDRHGGTEHRYWIRTIADHLKKQGYEVAEEFPVGGGKAIDIVASRNSKRIAFEVETGKSDVNTNVEKALLANIRPIYIVATSAKTKRIIESKLTGYNGVKVLTVNEAITRKSW